MTAHARALPVTLRLPYAISANRYWKRFAMGARVMQAPSSEAKQYRKDVATIGMAAGLRPIAGPVSLSLTLHPVEPKDAAARARRLGPGWHWDVR